jgi:hypothetical protein
VELICRAAAYLNMAIEGTAAQRRLAPSSAAPHRRRYLSHT